MYYSKVVVRLAARACFHPQAFSGYKQGRFECRATKCADNMLSKAPSEYVKTIPQHIRAAKQLESIRELKKGDKISFIKILNKPGVKPVELAKKEEIDSKKYMEFLESTLERITSSMDLDFDTILGKPKQTGLDEFFWS